MYRFLNADHYPFVAHIKYDSEELKFSPNPLMVDAIFKLFDRESQEYQTVNNALNLIINEYVNVDFINLCNSEDNNVILYGLIDNKLKEMAKMWLQLASTNSSLYKVDDMLFDYIDDSLKG